MNLRVKLLLWVGLPFCIIFFAVSVFSYWNARTLLERMTTNSKCALLIMRPCKMHAVDHSFHQCYTSY